MNGKRIEQPGELRYAGKGQIVRVADGALVSPRDVVSAYNDLLSAGHAAAMRGALRLIKQMGIDLRNVVSLLDRKDGRREQCLKTSIEIYQTAERALFEPPRNCDLYGGDYKMLHTAWFDWSGSPSGCNPDGTVKLTFGEWLLATEKKGGAA